MSPATAWNAGVAVARPPRPSRPSAPSPSRQSPRQKPDVLLKLVGIIILTYIWRVQDMIGPLSKLKFPTMITLLVLWTYSTDMKPIRRYRLVKCGIMTMLLVMAGIIAAGIPTSILPGATLDFYLKDFLPDVLMVVVVAASVRGLRDLEWLLAVHVAGATIYNIYALVFFGLDGSGRLGGALYYDANDFSQTIILTLPVTMYFLRAGSSGWQKKLACAALPFLLINFVRAGSRGGFLGFAAIAVCSLFGFAPIKPIKRFAAVAIMLGGISAVGGDAFWAKMRTILKPNDDYNMQSDTGRWQLWKNALSIVRQRPFVGVGARQYPEANATLSDLARARIEGGLGMIPWQRAHNAYVSVAAETGVIGFVVFCSLLIACLALSIMLTIRGGRTPGGADLAAISRMLAIALVGFMVSAFFLTAEYQAVLYLNIGLLLATRKLVNVTMAAAPPPPPKRRRRRRIVASPAAAVVRP
jgi:hypothetical protein